MSGVRLFAVMACVGMANIAASFAAGLQEPLPALAGVPAWLWWWPAVLWLLLALRILFRGTDR